MIDCGYCQKPIPDTAGCNIIEDEDFMWLLHPACYDKWLAEGEAKEQEKLQQAQAKENERLQAEINWLQVNGNRAINIIRGLLATETVEQEKWLKESLEATIDLIKAPKEAH